MGVLGKLMFWHKKEELGDNLGLPKDTFPGPNPYQGDYGQQQPWSQPGMGSYTQPQMPTAQMPQMESLQSSSAYAASKQMELISAKLDALKAAIDALNQRIANMERIKETEDYYRKKGW